MLRYCRFTSYCQKYYRNIPALFSLFPPWQHLKKIQYIITMAPLATVKTEHSSPQGSPQLPLLPHTLFFPVPHALFYPWQPLMSPPFLHISHVKNAKLMESFGMWPSGHWLFFTQHNSSKMLCISIAALLFFYHWYGWTTVCNHFTCWETSVLVPDLG